MWYAVIQSNTKLQLAYGSSNISKLALPTVNFYIIQMLGAFPLCHAMNERIPKKLLENSIVAFLYNKLRRCARRDVSRYCIETLCDVGYFFKWKNCLIQRSEETHLGKPFCVWCFCLRCVPPFFPIYWSIRTYTWVGRYTHGEKKLRGCRSCFFY